MINTWQSRYDWQRNRCLGRFTIDSRLRDGTAKYDEFVIDRYSSETPEQQVREYIDSLMRAD